MKKKLSFISILLALAMIVSIFSACAVGGEYVKDDDDDDDKKSKNEKPVKEEITLEGDDVFCGESFTEMLWGHYEEESYDYNGSHDDTKKFRKDMEYVTMDLGDDSEEKLSVLPIEMDFGKFSHFVGSFTYEDEYYQPYTELGRAMFRKAYIEEVGDMDEEEFLKIENLLDLDLAQMTFTDNEGYTYTVNYMYSIKKNVLSLYQLEIDDDYNTEIGKEPFLEYTFLHDGGKLTLLCGEVQRSYLTGGYKETDSSFCFSGYALNEKNTYEDLAGINYYDFKDGDISVYVELNSGNHPIDPVMEVDTKTGDFTLSWDSYYDVSDYYEEVTEPFEVSGKIVPCTSYNTYFDGFILIIDGECYRYQMSEDEYYERMDNSFEDDDLSDTERQELTETKTDILEELDEAFDAAGLDLDIDYETGIVSIEANFLFATDSYEISQEGKDYLDIYMDLYTSVLMMEEYAPYVVGIVVEGHTDTNGSYSYNQTLSENRANAVVEHCVAHNPAIADSIYATGCSYDYPVYNDDGSVNMDASRRVTFSFMLSAY